MDGAVIVNKEKGYTSFDVVAKSRGIFGTRKIGHTGTLDPQAEGVLVLCLGKATSAVEMLADHDKEYEAVMLLGRTTDTEDVWGKTTAEREVRVTEDEIRAACARFTGVILQTPPAYSALKVNGKRSYDLAREGKAVKLEPRKITVHELEILRIDLPEVTFRVRCSKGSYIRSLCRDIGEALGCGACMSGLLRTRVGGFGIAEARTLGELQSLKDAGRLAEAVIRPEDLFPELPERTVSAEAEKLLANGNKLPAEALTSVLPTSARSAAGPERSGPLPDGQLVRVYAPDGTFRALYRYEENARVFRAAKMF
ncbi:MAG: tRNA pseudouridine(55) synthase TruB [Lachnospiraceae bacterium]|nr:tRNA pseudouridine(55) synthase TruB [Lachnospiraceae bacterium]